MRVFLLGSAILALPIPSRVVPLTPTEVGKPIELRCPIGEITRLILPEPLLTLKASPGAGLALGVEATQARPFGIVSLRPPRASTGTLEARGPTLLLTFVIRAVPEGRGGDLRFTLIPPQSPPPPSHSPVIESSPASKGASATPGIPMAPEVPEPTKGAPLPPSPIETPEPPLVTAGSPATEGRSEGQSVDALDLDAEGFLSAKVTRIGREEGMPGRPPCVLEDRGDGTGASTGTVWLRFTLKGGRGQRVDAVTRDDKVPVVYQQNDDGRDLRIRVKTEAKGLRRISVKVGHALYTFRPTRPPFLRVLDALH